MKRVMLFLAGCIFAASIVLNIYYSGKISALKKKEKASSSETAHTVKNSPAAPPSEKENNDFHFRSAEFYSWSNRICVEFSNVPLLTEASLAKSVTITPAIPLRFESTPGYLSLKGDFQPDKTYQVRLADSLTSTKGGKLLAPAVFFIKIPERSPKIRFLTTGPILPCKAGRITLPYAVTNVKKASLEIRKYYNDHPDTFNPWISYNESASRTVFEKEMTFQLPRNKEVFRELDLAKLQEKHGQGIYSIHFSWKESSSRGNWDSERESLHFILTDLAVSSTLPVNASTGTKGGVFVRSLSSNLAVSGAAVTLVSSKNQLFAKGITDRDGKCVLSIKRHFDDKYDRPERIVVRKGNDITWLPLAFSHDLSRFEDGERISIGKQEAFVYTIRGICRPGETIHGGIFLRKEVGGKTIAVPRTLLDVILTDPAGTRLPAKRITTNEHGFANISFQIPDDARTGRWAVTVQTPGQSIKDTPAGSCGFQVGEYVPDRIKAVLNIKDDPETVTGKDKVTFLPAANYYFGTPVHTAAKGQFQVKVTPLDKLPAHWKGYIVGDGMESFRSGSTFFRQGTIHNTAIEYPGFEKCGGKSKVPLLLTGIFTIAEPGGRSVSASRSIPCSVMDLYLGVAGKIRQDEKKSVLLDWKLLSMQKNIPVDKRERTYLLKIVKKEWKYLLKENNGKYSYEWIRKEIPVKELQVTSSGNSGFFSLGELAPGQYTVTVSSGKMKTKHSFWHNEGSAGKRSPHLADLPLSTNKKVYAPGETAVLTFDSPGKGAVLLASGNPEDLKLQTIPVLAGKNTIRLKIPENISSEICHAAFTLVTGKKSSLKRAFTLARLKVDLSAAGKLDVKIVHPSRALPGEEIPVKITLKNGRGKPVAGTVHLFGCDAGILALTDWKTPDIYEFFSGKKSCSFTFADMYDSLFPELKLQTNGKFGGGAASPASMKKRAALLSHIKLKTNAPALFDLGIWKTDANGIAAGKVKLPDFTGSMLLSAVTADSTRTGSGKSELTIKDRTGVTVSLPAAAAPGDEFESVFTLFNFDLPAGEGTFSLELPESWKALSKKDFTFSLAKGGQAVCRIKLLVPEKTGNHAIRYIYTFKSGKETVKKTGTATLAVRHKIPEGMESSFTLLPRGGNLVVSGKNDKWYPDPFSVTVTISDSPLSLLSDALDFLRSYPYGCLEQTAAGAFPMLSANALYACGLISKEHMQTANRTVMQASYRILSMLRYDGSFSMWPGAGNEFRSGTLFASHFLFEAEEKTSLSIPITARNLICRHLYNIADDASLARGERAYAAYILALADSSRFLKPARNLLADGKQDLASLFASAALIRGGFAAEGAYHMKQTLEKEVWREKDMPYSCADDNVRAGMVLYLLSRADAKAPGSLKLLDRLQQTLRKDGLGWGTTQANAWAVLGISSWAEANQLALDREAKNKTIGIIHLSSGKKIPVLTGKSVELQLEKDGENRIINNDSPGLFITMRTRGIMRKGVEKANGITVKREYLNKEGKVITKAAHGELVTVRLTTWTETFVPDAVIVDLLPGGLEIEDGSLATREKVSPGMDPDSPTVKFKENRHDRFLLFCDLEGKQVYTYKARAVIRGKYANCAIAAEKMYDPDTAALSLPEGFFEVK